MILSMNGFIDSIPAATAMLIYDITHTYEWPNNLVLGAAFTALIFRGEFSKDGLRIFSKQNTRPLFVIIQIHIAFLAILMGIMWLAQYVEPSLPNWLTNSSNPGGKPDSILDLLLILGMIGLHFVEYRWLYVKSGTNDSEPEDDQS